jgi:16S rRNA (cytosine967-C5)-methyltransferase
MQHKQLDPRHAAVLQLEAVISNKSSLASSESYLKKMDSEDISLFQVLTLGVCRHYFELDAYINHFLSKPLKQKDNDILSLMLMGCYQLLYMRTPAHAAIHTSVELCRTIKKKWACNLVNAVLRNIQRQSNHEEKWAVLQNTLTPCQQSSHPKWLYDAIFTQWPNHYESILEANNLHPKICLRIKDSASLPSYIAQLSEQGIEATPSSLSDKALILEQTINPKNLPGFHEGHVSIQDDVAQLCALLLDPKPHDYILDACAAPGGKSAQLLELADIELLSIDIDKKRCERIQENFSRLHIESSIITADASDTASWWDQKPFDRILLDAPCSATGVIRHHPDIKLLRQASDIKGLALAQHTLLRALWPTLKENGRLIYCTCSILEEENDLQIHSFLQDHPNANIIPITSLPKQDRVIPLTYGLQVLPSATGSDGFYFVILEKSPVT